MVRIWYLMRTRFRLIGRRLRFGSSRMTARRRRRGIRRPLLSSIYSRVCTRLRLKDVLVRLCVR